MKNLIKKILKEENDFDWARDTNPMSKSEITNQLGDLQDWGYFIHERWLDTNKLVDFIYRLGLSEEKLNEISVVLYDLSESIYENGRERGQQEGWEEGNNEGYREGKYDGERDAKADINDDIEEARDDGYDEGYEDGLVQGIEDGKIELEKDLKEREEIIYNKGFEEGRMYEAGLDSEEYERKQSGLDFEYEN